ncbi:MAG TPA: DnaA/Hda family protein, partial [Longimicrobiaceae bacterium]|nr:DnaA/Hda family protein [Longimicrobiaceae bacterium]
LRAGVGEMWRRRYHGVDLLLLDALHELSGDERVQEEVFYLLDALLRSDTQLVVAADRPPRELAGLDARLRSRLEGGLVVDLARPVAPPPAPAGRGSGDGTDRWFFNPEKVAWSALALEDRLIEELA